MNILSPAAGDPLRRYKGFRFLFFFLSLIFFVSAILASALVLLLPSIVCTMIGLILHEHIDMQNFDDLFEMNRQHRIDHHEALRQWIDMQNFIDFEQQRHTQDDQKYQEWMRFAARYEREKA